MEKMTSYFVEYFESMYDLKNFLIKNKIRPEKIVHITEQQRERICLLYYV